MDSASRSGGLFFAGGGGFFALIGAVMLLVQTVWGEWPFDVDGEQKPLGAEFAWTFFAFGQVFLFVGLGLCTRRRRRRAVFNSLAAANGLLVVLLIAALLVQGADVGWSLTWQPLAVWAVLLVGGCAAATRHPDYRHADRLPELPEAEPSRRHQQRSALKARAILKPIRRRDWLWAGLAGFSLGAVVVGIFGGFMLHAGAFEGGESDIVLAGFLLLAFLMFGGFGMGAAMLVIVFTRAWRGVTGNLLGEYEQFAHQVGGRVVQRQQGLSFLPASLPEGVVFPHGEGEARLEIVVEGAGDTRITYTHLTFALAQPADFTCRVSTKGGLLGLQDVSLGWPLFDDLFVVKADNEYQAGEVLDRPVQEELVELRHWAERQPISRSVGSPEVELRIEQGELTVRVEGLLDLAEKLLDFRDRAGRIKEQVRANLHAR